MDNFVVLMLFDNVCCLVGDVGDNKQWCEYFGGNVYYVVGNSRELVEIGEYFFVFLYYCFQVIGDVVYFQ